MFELWSTIAIIVTTILGLSLFGKKIEQLEEKLTDWFSVATSKKRWFSSWILIFVLWIACHRLFLGHGWYSEDVDLIILTGLFSAVPFWVENSLKHGQAKFQDLLMDLTKQHSIMLSLAAARDEATLTLVEKLFDALEVPHDPDSAMESPDCTDQGSPTKTHQGE